MSDEVRQDLDQANPKLLGIYLSQVQRFDQLSLFLAQKNTTFLDRDAWVGKCTLRSDITALINLLIRKGVLTADEFIDESANQMELQLLNLQVIHRIIVTPQGIVMASDLTQKGNKP